MRYVLRVGRVRTRNTPTRNPQQGTCKVIAGDEYSADVLLVASNSTTNPKIIVGDTSKLKSGGEGKELPVEGGLGKYTIRTSAEGLQKWSGVIKVEKPGRPGEFDSYPFSSEYQVAKPAAAVSATKMNVFYIGVDNPVDISAAGVAPENIVATSCWKWWYFNQIKQWKIQCSRCFRF